MVQQEGSSVKIKYFLCAIIYLISCIDTSHGFYPKEQFYNNDQIVTKWQTASNYFDHIAWSSKDILIKVIDQLISSNETKSRISDGCFESLQHLDKGLKERKLWSYQFIDAWSRGHASVLRGSLGTEGKTSDCVDINVDIRKTRRETFSFSGKQCYVKVNFPLPPIEPSKEDPMAALKLNVSNTNLSSTVYEYYADRLEYWFRDSFTFGICVPNKCSKDDLLYMLQTQSNGTELVVGLRKYCDSNDERKNSPVPFISWISFWIICIISFIVIFSTFVCIIMDKVKIKNKWSLLRHFDMRASNSKLATVDIKNPNAVIMRPMEMFISIAQIFAICGHALIAGVLVPAAFPVFKEYRDLFGSGFAIGKQYIFFLTMGAQAWFAMSGFFCCYIVLPMFQKADGKIPFHLYALKRYLRTIPTLLVTIFLTFSARVYITHPVVKEAFDIFDGSCQKRWWQTILMINNYDVPLKDICVLQSWYLSADFQLWLVSYIPLFLMVKRPKVGVAVCLFFMFASSLSTSITTHFLQLPAYLVGREIELFHFFLFTKKFVWWFLSTNNGVFSYYFGFLTSYYCLTAKKISSPLTFRWLIINCFLIWFAGGIILAPFVWTQFFKFPAVRPVEIVYAAFARAPFGLFYAFLLLNVYYGFYKFLPFMKGIVNSNVWVIIGRLTFSVFLSHILTITFVSAVMFDQKFPTTLGAIMTYFLSFTLVAFFFGYLLYLFVEAPFNSLITQLVQKRIPAGLKKEPNPDDDDQKDEDDDDSRSSSQNNSSRTESRRESDDSTHHQNNNRRSNRNHRPHVSLDMNGNHNQGFDEIEISEISADAKHGA